MKEFGFNDWNDVYNALVFCALGLDGNDKSPWYVLDAIPWDEDAENMISWDDVEGEFRDIIDGNDIPNFDFKAILLESMECCESTKEKPLTTEFKNWCYKITNKIRDKYNEYLGKFKDMEYRKHADKKNSKIAIVKLLVKDSWDSLKQYEDDNWKNLIGMLYEDFCSNEDIDQFVSRCYKGIENKLTIRLVGNVYVNFFDRLQDI